MSHAVVVCPDCWRVIGASGRQCACGTWYHEPCLRAGCVIPGCGDASSRGAAAVRRWPCWWEVLIVASIVTALASVAVPWFRDAQQRAMRRACYANQKTIVGAVEMYNSSLCSQRPQKVLDRKLLEELRSGGYLPSVPADPGWGADSWSHYHLTTDGNGITCEAHGPVQ